MSDALWTGTKRLALVAAANVEEIDMSGEEVHVIIDPVAFASDPGVKAKHAFVLHFAELDCCCNQMERLLRDLAGPDSSPYKCYSCLARIVLETWEHGKPTERN